MSMQRASYTIIIIIIAVDNAPYKCYTNSKVRAPSEKKPNSEQVRL